MDWIPVDSSILDRIRYDQDSMTPEVEFKGGQVYHYFDVPLKIFEGLRDSDSYGKYFSSQIKGHYRYARV